MMIQKMAMLWLTIVALSLTSCTKVTTDRGARLETLTGSPVWALAVTPDGRKAISGSNDGTLEVWDLTIRGWGRTLTGHHGPVGAVAVTPDGKRIVSGGSDGTLKVWDLATGACLQTLSVGTFKVVGAIAKTPVAEKLPDVVDAVAVAR
jgi:WD40 repeat protein